VANLLPILLPTHVKADGDVASGYYIEFFVADGTYTTNKDVYTDAAETVTASNPHPLDASGWPTSDLYGDGLYDIKIYDGDPSGSGSLVKSREKVGFNFSPTASGSDNLVLNGSAEIDVGGDDQPDYWTASADSGGTLDRYTTDSNHGTASFRFVSTGVGSGTQTSTTFECSPSQALSLSFDLKCSIATNNPVLTVYWLDRSQSALSSDVVYNNAATNPTDWTRIKNLSVTPPADAVYAYLEMDGVANAASGTTYIDNVVISADNNPVSPSQPQGMILSIDGGDTDHDVNITAGEVRDYTDTYNIIHESEVTKQIDAPWAEGDDAGGMDTGSVAVDEMYAVWAIASSTTGISDYLFSLSFTAPTMPSGYDKKNLIGVVWTDSSANLVDFAHYGNEFTILGDPLDDVTDTTITHNTYETATLRVPPNCIGRITGSMYNNTTTDNECYFHLRSNDATEVTGPFNAWVGFANQGATKTQEVSREGNIYVDDSSQVQYAAIEALGGDTEVRIYTRGCSMLTRGNPNI
jgi:hypothetical protein